MKYAFSVLRNNAKRRNVEFTLTFEQFEKFCIKYDYLAGKGKTKESYSIDRIDNSRGYVEDNIAILTLSENSRKGTKTLHAYYDHYERKVVAHVSTRKPIDEDDFDWDSVFSTACNAIEQGIDNHSNCSCCDSEHEHFNTHENDNESDCPF